MYSFSSDFKFRCIGYSRDPFCSSEYDTGSINGCHVFQPGEDNLALLNRDYLFWMILDFLRKLVYVFCVVKDI